jgi:hypothetical protein
MGTGRLSPPLDRDRSLSCLLRVLGTSVGNAGLRAGTPPPRASLGAAVRFGRQHRRAQAMMQVPDPVLTASHAMPAPFRRRHPFGLGFALLGALGSPFLADAVSDPPTATTKVLRDGRFELDAEGRSLDGQVVTASPAVNRSTIAILPDRTTGDDWGLPHLARAVEDLNLLRPDAVFCVGDLVQGYTRDLETWDREADDYLRIVGNLDADFWPTAGNHDVISGERDASDRRFADRYRERFGPLHYAVRLDHGTVIVLFSDESLDGGDVIFSDEQSAWLKGVLEATDPTTPTVLLMHRPLWRYRDIRWFDRVHPMLIEHDVDAVIAGHFHALQRDDDRDGIEYHLLGVCGGAIDQHPLTGQFNHLSLLDLGPGDEVHVRHLPTGVVLDDDFVTRADQDRGYRLKSNARTVEVRGVLPDPRGGMVETSIEVEVRNPIDRPVTVSIAAAGPSEPWLVDGYNFLARTMDDVANLATTDLATPFRIESVDDVTIAAGESRTIRIGVTAEATDAPPPPPELVATVTFADDHDRLVPIRLPRRIPVERFDDDLADGEPIWPIAAWEHSVYEEREPLGSLRTTIEDGQLIIDLRFFDDRLADDDVSPESTAKGRRNPHGDLVMIEVTARDDVSRWIFEPADRPAGSPRLLRLGREGGVEEIFEDAIQRGASTRSQPPLHRFRIGIPGVNAGEIEAFQLEIADNDRTYHTQWRRVAPAGGGILVRPAAP